MKFAAPVPKGAGPADQLLKQAWVLVLQLLRRAPLEVVELPAIFAGSAGLRGLVHTALDVIVAGLGRDLSN
jgi:hypothetical protein